MAAMTERPLIFVTSQRLEEIRTACGVEGSTHALAWQQLLRKLDRIAEGSFEPPKAQNMEKAPYHLGYEATCQAFAFLITQDRAWAEAAYATLSRLTDPDRPESMVPLRHSGLARATIGAAVATTFNWCHAAWTESQRSHVEQAVICALDDWPNFEHPNLFNDPGRGSNWVAVCRGGELVMMIAAGLQHQRADRFAYLKSQLSLHVQNGYDELGVSQEGIGYIGYAGIFLQRARLALLSMGDQDLDPVFQTRNWHRLAMFAGSFATFQNQKPANEPAGRQGAWLMSGVGGPGIGDEGWASMLLGCAPSELAPYFLWWFDHHLGIYSSLGPDAMFDKRREGLVWTLIYYTEHLVPADPTGDDRFLGAIGKAGLGFFRNRWEDGEDILVSLHADTHTHPNAWDQPEALQIGLMAHRTLYIAGPNKERGPDRFSTLLVDGQHHHPEMRSHANGKLEGFEANRNGGWMIVSGGSQYEALGIERVTRQLLVRFDNPQNKAIISTLDTIQSSRPHRYAWQACTRDPGECFDVRTGIGDGVDTPLFTLRPGDDTNTGRVFGWAFLLPSPGTEMPTDCRPVIQNDAPLQIGFAGTNAILWVIMLVGNADESPTARFDPTQPTGPEVTIGQHCLRYDPSTGRIDIR